MIILTFLYLSLASFALPACFDVPTDIHLSVYTRSADRLDSRSIWSIVWSCFSTLFACTWLAVHPNIPAPDDSRWVVLRRRVAIMGYVLIAPELVICWAARQHFGARHLAKRHQERGWTMVHGFFMIMGGFTLHDNQGKALRILEPKELETLYKARKIAWPSITEKEIQDRSKGDYLSKAIVLGQTSWFVTQCIERGASGLAVTELEVATLAFAAVTGVTYYLWWHKPLDVQCSVPVYPLDICKDYNGKKVDPESVLSSSSAANPPSVSRPSSCGPIEELDATQVNVNPPLREETQIQSVLIPPSPRRNPKESNFASTPGPSPKVTQLQRFSALIQHQRQKRGTFLGIAYIFLIYPIFVVLEPPIAMADSDALHDASPLRVPTFYAPRTSKKNYGFFLRTAGCVAVIFGGIHCIAWSFYFPSLHERLAWRISAACVSVLPVFIFPFIIFSHTPLPQGGHKNKLGFSSGVALLHTVTIALAVVYAVARVILLVLACITLRALPPTAFTQIQWVSFFPHIG